MLGLIDFLAQDALGTGDSELCNLFPKLITGLLRGKHRPYFTGKARTSGGGKKRSS